MKQLLILLVTITLLSVQALAQMPYTFSVYTQPYAPLASATLFHPGLVWNTNSIFTAPIGFPFMIDTFHCTDFFSEGGNVAVTDTTNVTQSGFILTDAFLDDRGSVGGGSVSLSPVRYEVTGSAGHQIFKYEVFNAGFDQQLIDSGFMTDSVNLQIWYYQDSGIVELRYGASLITGTDYFNLTNTTTGYFEDIDTNGNGTIYILAGNPASPTVQTVPLIDGNPTVSYASLLSFPASGTVYRFAPVSYPSNGVAAVFTPENVKIYPTCAYDQVMVNYKGNETLSYDILSVNGARTNISGNADNGITHINISNLPAGMYLLHLQGSGDSKVYKFVKAR